MPKFNITFTKTATVEAADVQEAQTSAQNTLDAGSAFDGETKFAVEQLCEAEAANTDTNEAKAVDQAA